MLDEGRLSLLLLKIGVHDGLLLLERALLAYYTPADRLASLDQST